MKDVEKIERLAQEQRDLIEEYEDRIRRKGAELAKALEKHAGDSTLIAMHVRDDAREIARLRESIQVCRANLSVLCKAAYVIGEDAR